MKIKEIEMVELEVGGKGHAAVGVAVAERS